LLFPGQGRRGIGGILWVRNHLLRAREVWEPCLIAEESQYRAWMIAAQAGDGVAYRTLLTALGGHLRTYYTRRIGPTTAEDLVQETLIAMHTRRATYDTAQPFTAWVYGIARYKLIDEYRRSKRRASVPLDEAPELFARDDAEAASAKRDVDKLLATLPPARAELVRSAKIEGLSTAEVAARMGMSETAVKVGIHRAIKTLHGNLAQGGDDENG
jgi:RNA polymerase sigma-70 factor (ECF subfamily)